MICLFLECKFKDDNEYEGRGDTDDFGYEASRFPSFTGRKYTDGAPAREARGIPETSRVIPPLKHIVGGVGDPRPGDTTGPKK